MAVISYLGIGSNMGDRRSNIIKAISLLKDRKIRIKKISSIIETEAVGGLCQANFLNAAIKVQTQLSPRRFLTTLKQIEKELGRKKTLRNGPRPIDLDILLYGKRRIRTSVLIVPHPRMLKRDFVMAPFLEIASKSAREFLGCN